MMNYIILGLAVIFGIIIFVYFSQRKKVQPTLVEKKVEATKIPVKTWQDRLVKGLEKSRTGVWDKLKTLVTSTGENSEEVEELLYSADLPVEVVQEITKKVSGNTIDIQKKIFDFFNEALKPVQAKKSSLFEKNSNGPRVIMIVGVNGVGKTTTIGKLATQFKRRNFKVLVGACDTFRAAAVDQLEVWCKRADVDMVRAQNNSDPSGVAFDTVARAYKENYDVCLIDTAGRLHNNVNLMEELAKTKRVMSKINPSAPHEVFLVLDAITGQNAVKQAQEFHKSLNLTGLILTKCDGSAKAGSAIYIIKELQVPAYFVGVGEDVEDLDEFDLNLYLNALLGI